MYKNEYATHTWKLSNLLGRSWKTEIDKREKKEISSDAAEIVCKVACSPYNEEREK